MTKEATEPFLEKSKMMYQSIMEAKPAYILKANVAPTTVATPLPPWNFNQTGKMWPKMAARAIIIDSLRETARKARQTGTNPLSMSPASTKRAGFQPSIR